MGCEFKKKKAFQLHVTVRKDHSSLDCLCQNRLWLFLPAKIGSEIQKTQWLWIYRLENRSQYFMIHNHTTKKKADGKCYCVDSLMSPLHHLHQQAQFIFLLNAVLPCRWCNVRAPSGDFHTFCSVVYLMADCADQHALNRPHHYVTAPLSVQRDRMDFFLWACSAGCALSWSDRAWTHRSELYMML